jgi:hypothetical protein
MRKKNSLIRNLLVLGIIVLLIGIAVQPSTATVQNELIDKNKKEFLFQTIIDITNKKEIEDLIDNEKNSGFFLDFNYNLRSIYREILLKDPALVRSLIFSKQKITQDYLNFAYNSGCKITNILGEEKVFELVDSITVKNPAFSDKLSNIIENNEEINNKISELKIINQELNPTSPFDGYPIICGVLLMLTFTFALPMFSIFFLILLLSSHPLLGPLFVGLLGLFSANLAFFLALVKTFC